MDGEKKWVGTVADASAALTCVWFGIECPPPGPGGAAMAKLRAAQVAHTVVSTALQLHGANGRLRGHPLEYLFRFARGYRIAGGTDDILQNTIVRSLTDGEVRGVL